LGKKCQSFQSEKNLSKLTSNLATSPTVKLTHDTVSFKYTWWGEGSKHMNLLQSLGKKSGMTQISPKKAGLQLRADFWLLLYQVGTFPMFAFEINRGSVNRFAKVEI
jgi:hypothetical protein